jgi:K+-sensing histidine kinase KdpD
VELTALAIGAAMLVAAVVVLVLARRFAERGYVKQERYRSQLFDAELSALTRLREANRIREDLVASVSHEFRTPLTAIRGSAATLAARGDRIPPEARDTLLRGIVEHAGRLNKLLEDMLLAASARPAAESDAVADVTGALSAFRLGQARPPVALDIAPDLAAYVDAVSLDRVVRALVDHVQAEARRDRPVTLRAGRQGGEVVVDLLYDGTRSEAELRELFEPFGSRESAETGRPATLAAAGRDGDRLRVRIALRALRPTADLPVRTPV